MAKKIVIIDHDGDDVNIEAFGFKGKGCEAAIRKVQEQLGGQVKSSRHKPEYHQSASTTTGTKQTT